MKIAYVARINYLENSGVTKKITNQIKNWRLFGHETRLFCITRNKDVADFLIKIGETAFFYTGGPFSKSHSQAAKELADSIERWNPDIGYFRSTFVYPGYINIVKRMTTVLEINTNEIMEIISLGMKFSAIYHWMTKRFLDRNAKGFVFVAQQIKELPYYSKYKVPKIVIGNGIDLQSFPSAQPVFNKDPVFVFVGPSSYSGHGSNKVVKASSSSARKFKIPWHGVDKIIKMAKLFPKWTFHIIGYEELYPKLPNIITHGMLPFNEYISIMQQADVGIGTLAFHRNKMDEASPLKVREYLACGLPVIIGYKDTDFPNGAPFILQIPNTEDNIERSVEDIRKFVESWRGKRVPKEAITHLDYREKEKQRIEFFNHVLENEVK